MKLLQPESMENSGFNPQVSCITWKNVVQLLGRAGYSPRAAECGSKFIQQAGVGKLQDFPAWQIKVPAQPLLCAPGEDVQIS